VYIAGPVSIAAADKCRLSQRDRTRLHEAVVVNGRMLCSVRRDVAPLSVQSLSYAAAANVTPIYTVSGKKVPLNFLP